MKMKDSVMNKLCAENAELKQQRDELQARWDYYQVFLKDQGVESTAQLAIQRDHYKEMDALHIESLGLKSAELAEVTQQRDELLAALEEIGNTACGEASHQYMALAAIDAAMGEKP